MLCALLRGLTGGRIKRQAIVSDLFFRERLLFVNRTLIPYRLWRSADTVRQKAPQAYNILWFHGFSCPQRAANRHVIERIMVVFVNMSGRRLPCPTQAGCAPLLDVCGSDNIIARASCLVGTRPAHGLPTFLRAPQSAHRRDFVGTQPQIL
jgi:hypothetical protein